jgi:nucleotide-binding universal stress UspA family protein
MAATRRFLVAVDASENAEWAFNFTTSIMDKHNDELHLITVRKEDTYAGAYGIGAAYAYDIMVKAREAEKAKCKKLLRTFAKKAHQVGIAKPLKLTMGAGHIGDIICGYVKEEKVDFLVMGRRGMGAIKRLFLGSNSKYCTEEADCNVIIVKHPFGPEEQHDASKQEIIDAEEEERRWRIEEYQRKMEEEKKAHEEESKKDLELVRKMEEEERLRREKEDQPTRSISGRAND